MKNKTPKVLFGVLVGLIILSFLPLSNTITVPAVLHYKDFKAFYAPVSARVDKVHVENLQKVSQGDVLITLSSEDLGQEIELTRLNLKLYQTIRKRQQASKELSRENLDIDQKIREGEVKLAGLLLEKDELLIKAPFDGVVRDMMPEAHIGRWVNPRLLLVRVIDENSLQVSAYLDSGIIERVKQPAPGIFKSDAKMLGSYNLELAEVSGADTRDIAYQELASVYGGPIPADHNKETGAMSKIPLYVLKFSVGNSSVKPKFTQKGIVNLKVQSRSFSGRILEKLASLFLRETGI